MNLIQHALFILKSSSELKLEEVLELFPKKMSAITGEMKQHLCSVLDDYDDRLTRMHDVTETYSKVSEVLRAQKYRQRSRAIQVRPSDDCSICYSSVTSRGEFLVYPCGHAFHRDCVRSRLWDYSTRNPSIREPVDFINDQFA